MMKKKILINCTMGNVLRFLPPLIVTKEEMDRVVKASKRYSKVGVWSAECENAKLRTQTNYGYGRIVWMELT